MLQRFNLIIGEARLVFKEKGPEKGPGAHSGTNPEADQDALLQLESLATLGLLTPDMKIELDALRAKAKVEAARRAEAGKRAMDKIAGAGRTAPIDFTQEPEAAKLRRTPSPLPETAPTESRVPTQGVVEINGKQTTRDNIIIFADALIQDSEVTWDEVKSAVEEYYGVTLPHDLEHSGTNGAEPTAEQVADLIIKVAAGKAPRMDQIALNRGADDGN